MMRALEHLLHCLKICLSVLGHRRIAVHSFDQMMCDVVLKQAHHRRIFFEFEETINAETVHVVVYFNNLLCLRGPELFNFFSQYEGIFLAKVGIACLQHMFGVYERAKCKNYFVKINLSLNRKSLNASFFNVLLDADL